MLLTCVKWYALIHIYWIIMLSFWSLSTSPLLSLLMFILIPLKTIYTHSKLTLQYIQLSMCIPALNSLSFPFTCTYACSRYPKVTHMPVVGTLRLHAVVIQSVGSARTTVRKTQSGSPSSPRCIFPSTWWDLVTQLTEWSCWRGKRALAKSPRLYDTQNCRVPFLLWEPSRCWNRQEPSGCKTHTYT